MSVEHFLWAGFLSLLPISELRGGIPYAMITGGFPWWLAFLYCTAVNAAAGPLAYVFLATAHKLLYKAGFYARFFDRFVERARAKVHPQVEKYGMWGLMVFVAVPFPLTGAWTGILGGWILGLERRKVILSTALGVLIAGLIVTAIMVLANGAVTIFTNMDFVK